MFLKFLSRHINFAAKWVFLRAKNMGMIFFCVCVEYKYFSFISGEIFYGGFARSSAESSRGQCHSPKHEKKEREGSCCVKTL